jgi:hypothetical protein
VRAAVVPQHVAGAQETAARFGQRVQAAPRQGALARGDRHARAAGEFPHAQHEQRYLLVVGVRAKLAAQRRHALDLARLRAA